MFTNYEAQIMNEWWKIRFSLVFVYVLNFIKKILFKGFKVQKSNLNLLGFKACFLAPSFVKWWASYNIYSPILLISCCFSCFLLNCELPQCNLHSQKHVMCCTCYYHKQKGKLWIWKAAGENEQQESKSFVLIIHRLRTKDGAEEQRYIAISPMSTVS